MLLAILGQNISDHTAFQFRAIARALKTPPLARLGEQCLDFYMKNSKPKLNLKLKRKSKRKKKTALCSNHTVAAK